MSAFKFESIFAQGRQEKQSAAKQEQPTQEKKRLARNAVFAMALSMFIQHGDAPIDKESLPAHAVLERMVSKGPVTTDECEKIFSREFKEITLSEKNEAAFVAEYDQDGSCRILSAAYGTEGGVQISEERGQKILDTKDAVRFVFYHTHPAQNTIDILVKPLPKEDVEDIKRGNTPPFDTSMPSTDDIMTMVKKEVKKSEVAKGMDEPSLQKITTERVVTGLGIWEFGVMDGVAPETLVDESQKLGSLQTYYSLNKADPHIVDRLESIKKGYADVSVAYAKWEASQKQYSPEALRDFRDGKKEKLVFELKGRVLLAQNYATAMEKIGFKLIFRVHPEYQRMIEQVGK